MNTLLDKAVSKTGLFCLKSEAYVVFVYVCVPSCAADPLDFRCIIAAAVKSEEVT